MNKKELELKKRANLLTMVNSLKKDKGGRRIWTDEARKELIDFYDNRYKDIIIGIIISEDFMESTLKVHHNQIGNWRALYKKNGKMRSIVRSQSVAKVKPLKTNSIAAKGNKPRIIGTTLKNVLGNIDKKDLLQQVQMVDVLTDTGYEEDKLIDHLEIAAPSIEEWKQIKDALKLVTANFDIEVKSKT